MAVSNKVRPPVETVDLKEAVLRDWKHPQKLKDQFDVWLKTKPPFFEVAAATIFGSGQVGLNY